jgi:hypothetical protein
VIIFFSVRFLSKKSNQTEIKKKTTKAGSNRPVSVWFGFFGQKQVQTGFVRFFWFDLVLARFFPVWVRFGFFGFRLIKPKLN